LQTLKPHGAQLPQFAHPPSPTLSRVSSDNEQDDVAIVAGRVGSNGAWLNASITT